MGVMIASGGGFAPGYTFSKYAGMVRPNTAVAPDQRGNAISSALQSQGARRRTYPGVSARGGGRRADLTGLTPDKWNQSHGKLIGDLPADYRTYTNIYKDFSGPDEVRGGMAGVMARQNQTFEQRLAQGNASREVDSAPIYHEGDQFKFAQLNHLTPDAIAGWQKWFRANGFRTSPYTGWGSQEAASMKAVMKEANLMGVPVDQYRTAIQAQLDSGQLARNQLAASLFGTGAAPDGGVGGGGGGTGSGTDPYNEALAALQPTTSTSVSREVTQASMPQAMLLLKQYFSDQIGRDASDAEVAQFLKHLNGAYRHDPSTDRTVNTNDPMTGRSSQTTTSHNTGVDPSGEALQFSETADPEQRKRYQTLNFMNLIQQQVGGGG